MAHRALRQPFGELFSVPSPVHAMKAMTVFDRGLAVHVSRKGAQASAPRGAIRHSRGRPREAVCVCGGGTLVTLVTLVALLTPAGSTSTLTTRAGVRAGPRTRAVSVGTARAVRGCRDSLYNDGIHPTSRPRF